MATILTKKSDTSSSVPLAADLTNAAGGAELAVNTADKRLYSKTSGGSVVELGTNPSLMVLPSATSQPSGSANGVPYLNDSKVLTSGSALTFDGTGLGIGTGTIPAGRKLVIDSGNIRLSNDYQIEWGGATVGLYGNGSTNSLSFFANTSEQMRLTSTGLGIGTSSPGAKLHVKVGTNQNIFFDSSSGVARITAVNDAVNDNVDLLIQGETLRFNTDGTERMRLDSSGNLGLGVTPSAWSAYKVMQISGVSGVYANGSNEMGMFQNAYYNGGWKYGATGVAAAWSYQYQGQHVWQTAPSGTAGNAISFTQAATLTAAGEWLVGATSTVNAAKAVFSFNSSNNGVYIIDSTGVSGAQFMRFDSTSGTCGSITRVGTTSAVLYNTSSDYRLKNINGPLTNSGAYIDSLKPVEGSWKADGSAFVGLLAHEAQEVSRTSVATGQKDGSEMQAMDYGNSEFVANIIAELQSLRKRVAELEAK